MCTRRQVKDGFYEGTARRKGNPEQPPSTRQRNPEQPAMISGPLHSLRRGRAISTGTAASESWDFRAVVGSAILRNGGPEMIPPGNPKTPDFRELFQEPPIKPHFPKTPFFQNPVFCMGFFRGALAHTKARIHTHTHTASRALCSMHVCVHVCMHVWMYVCMHVCTYVCMYVCMSRGAGRLESS